MKGRGFVVLTVLSAFAAVAIFAGCGNDSSTSAAATDSGSESTASQKESSGPLTKDEFLKQANQICQRAVEKKDKGVVSLAETSTEPGKPPSSQALEKVVRFVVVPTYREAIDQIGELDAPKGDTAKVEKVLRTYAADLEAVETEPIKATKGYMFRDAHDLAEAYGIESCDF